MTERGDGRATDEERETAENDRGRNDDRRREGAEGEAEPEPDDGTAHLDDIEDGAGCTEIWERLSERREG